MKFSAVILAAAAATGVSAGFSNVTYTTEVVTALTTYCPEPTEIVQGTKTYTITKATTLTITDCPDHKCTVKVPITTSKIVECHACGHNATTIPPTPPKPTPTGTGSFTPTKPPSVPTAGAAKVAGAGLAGLVGLAAFIL